VHISSASTGTSKEVEISEFHQRRWAMKASSMITCALCIVVCQFAIGCAELGSGELDMQDCNEDGAGMVCLVYFTPELPDDIVNDEGANGLELERLEYAFAARVDAPGYEPGRRSLQPSHPGPQQVSGFEPYEPEIRVGGNDDDEKQFPEGDTALCPQRIAGVDGPDQCLVDIVPVEEPYEFVAVQCVYEPCED
jgi:hypothetical protein